MLLDRIDELPLRRHEIRGNPAGLLSGLVRRIDAMKAEAVGADAVADWAAEAERLAQTDEERRAAGREREFAELYAAHDAIVREGGGVAPGDLMLELRRLLSERADIRAALGKRFPHLMSDEFEETGLGKRLLLHKLAEDAESLCVACDDDQAVARFRGAAARNVADLQDRYPDLQEVVLNLCHRGGTDLLDAAHAVAAGIPHRLEKPHRASDTGATVEFWRCRSEQAQAQAAAREVDQLLAAGEVQAERVAVVVDPQTRQGRLAAAALEERSVPFRPAGGAALFSRPEVRDAIAWLRTLADPSDAAAAVRALTRPPVELRSIDLAHCTTIARRRKLDMVSAVEAALESPRISPEARERIQAFLKLYRSAAGSLEELRADVFVRRLIERVGLRRQQLFAAKASTAEGLIGLSRLCELAAAWARREPRASTRDFVRYLTAVAEAGVPEPDVNRSPGAVALLRAEETKGMEFEHVFLLGLQAGGLRPEQTTEIPDRLLAESVPEQSEATEDARRRRLAYLAMTRAKRSLVLSWCESVAEGEARPSPIYEDARVVLGAEEISHAEELFGPAEGLHSAYRMVRDEVLETAWKVGGSLGELRLDTYMDVNRAVARYLELLKLAALVQRRGEQPAAEALDSINELLLQAASEDVREALAGSSLDELLLSTEREDERRRKLVAAREEPSLEAFLPKRGDGLALSASDLDLYRTCPLKYKFARVFGIPQEPTVNQRFGILMHQVLERYHASEEEGLEPAERLERLLRLFEAGWRRAGFGSSDDELQFYERALDALRRYHSRQVESGSSPVWLERSFSFRIGPHQLRGRVDRVDRLAEGGYELIDYKTGQPKTEAALSDDLQLALYRLGAREAWQVDAAAQSYYYVLEDRKVAVEGSSDDLERVERAVLEAADGIMEQDFEPRPSPEICSWCDYRLICPAAEL
jgi:DNA helicase-2/ATP-dependent DNA helicase PcrA